MKKTLTISAFVVGLLIVRFVLTNIDRDDRRNACHMVRESVDRFMADTKAAPKSAQDLVNLGYLSDAKLAEGCGIEFPPNAN